MTEKKEWTEGGIKKEAKEFTDKWAAQMKEMFETVCLNCKAENCKSNETCIKCGCQL